MKKRLLVRLHKLTATYRAIDYILKTKSNLLYKQTFHKHKILITKQQVSDIDPLYKLADTSRIRLQPLTNSHLCL